MSLLLYGCCIMQCIFFLQTLTIHPQKCYTPALNRIVLQSNFITCIKQRYNIFDFWFIYFTFTLFRHFMGHFQLVFMFSSSNFFCDHRCGRFQLSWLAIEQFQDFQLCLTVSPVSTRPLFSSPVAGLASPISGAYLISGTGRFREIRVPNFRDDRTITEILTCLNPGLRKLLSA